MSTGSAAGGWILALDTATSRAIVALGEPDGSPASIAAWEAGHRHGEELLVRVRDVLEAAGTPLASLAGLVVGTGPGAFTGLRVGLATAKALASALGLPIAGISTAAALLEAASAPATALLLPAGPSDRILVRDGEALLLRGAEDDGLPPDDDLVAVDLAGRAPAAALERGRDALERLPEALLRLGAARLAAGESDDLARLVPDYVTLPRGIRAETGEVAWSRARR